MAPSSSGLGHQVLILKTEGSNPSGVTFRQALRKLSVSSAQALIKIRREGVWKMPK